MSYDFSKNQDKKEMSKNFPNVMYEKIDGKDCWFEWITQNEHKYQLLYYFDNNEDEYKVFVMAGLKGSEPLPIDINSSYNYPCRKAVETRERALQVLQSLGEVTKMTQEKMRLMVLGFSNAGKTVFLGSLGRLAYDDLRLRLRTEDYTSSDEISKLYKILAENKEGYNPPSTKRLRHHTVILEKGAKSVLKVEITDIEGQALEPNTSKDVAEQIVNEIGKYDGIILVIESPNTPKEVDSKKNELYRMLLFASEVLKKNRLVPITLVMTIAILNRT